MSPQPGTRPPSQAAFRFIFVTVVLDMLSVGIMVPVLPKLVLQFEGGVVADALRIVGLFGLVWAGMQFVFSPVMGALSDRFGRRPVILLSNLGLGLDYVLMAVAPTLGWLFVGRVIAGITSASFSTAGAYIADVSPPEERARKFGMLGAAFGLGFTIGPAVGGLLGQYDLRLPFWGAAVLSLANAAYGFFILPESLPREKRTPRFSLTRANPLGSLRLLGSHGQLLGLAATAFLYYLAHEALPSVWVLYTDYRYGWDADQVGWSLAAVGVASSIVSGGLVGPVVKKLGERRAILTGLTSGSLGFLVYALAPVGWIFMLGIPLVGLWGLTAPSMQALMSRRVGPSEQGQLQGALSSMRGISGMIGPLLFTQVFAWAIDRPEELHLPGMPYFVGGGLVLLALLLAFRVARPVGPAEGELRPGG